MKLVLFDIDGTLLLSDGAGKRAVYRALGDVFGASAPADHRFDGKTDPQIIRELMRLHGHADDLIDSRMPRLLDRYLQLLEEELADTHYHPYAMPGVPALLDALEKRPDVVLGLLTGNLERGASAKLRAVGIEPSRFRVGAFGSDHELRPELPAIAQRRARDRLGLEIPGSSLVVVGDTPADLTCGQALGARAIGVATGWYSVDALAEHHPAAVFADLSDTDRVVGAIVED